MIKKIMEKLSKYQYIKVYGERAEVLFKDDVVEVVVGSRKIIHDKITNKKISETLFSTEKVVVITYDENEKKISEEVFVDDKKVSGYIIDDDKKEIEEELKDDIKKSIKKYNKDGELVTEIIYTGRDRNKCDVEIVDITGEKYNSRSILVKNDDGDVIVDVKRKSTLDGRLISYSGDGLMVDVEYFKENKVKFLEISKEIPVYEESNKSQKQKNKSKSNDEKKQIGTKIDSQIIKFDELGRIVFFQKENETIVKEYYENNKPFRQYIIFDRENGKEVVGRVITIDDTVKIINNSTLSNEEIVKRNEEIFNIDNTHESFKLYSYNYEVRDNVLIVYKEIDVIGKQSEVRGKMFSFVENGVAYEVEEEYLNNRLSLVKKTNKVSGTQLIMQSNKKYIIGMDKIKKEVTDAEYEIYKIADELNKIEE